MDAEETVPGPDSPGADRAWPLAPLLAAVFLVRLVHLDQPLVENYVGRQIPTAMVARNLERGSGFLYPQLDTAPLPNYFVVEPPLYEWGLVALRRATGLTLGQAGRLVSALATAVAGWGLFAMIRRRSGRRAAWLAVGAFAALPITLRYGRAVQPDAAMLGAAVAGLACWDRFQIDRRRTWLAAGWLLLAVGFALKIIAACLLLPLILVVQRRWRTPEVLAAVSALLPAVLWYTWAHSLLMGGDGSRASADNRAIWLGLVGPSALLRPRTWELVGRFLFVRAFTPLGAVLAVWGLSCCAARRRVPRLGSPDEAGSSREGSIAGACRLWRAWMVAAAATLAILAQKLHHEYYFLILTPAVAAGVGSALDRFAAGGRRGLAAAMGIGLVLLGGLQARSTWRIPPEWADLAAAAEVVAATVPRDAWVVAPEALLFQADRRGCRLEWTPAAVRRAAGEWGAECEVHDAAELVEYYRLQGARYFADLGDVANDLRRMALHEAVRRRYKVIMDRPEVIVADLVVAERLPHAQ
jgi:4-amino-4-deoxy-L-arabinose transferase-like glycosyltransferase